MTNEFRSSFDSVQLLKTHFNPGIEDLIAVQFTLSALTDSGVYSRKVRDCYLLHYSDLLYL